MFKILVLSLLSIATSASAGEWDCATVTATAQKTAASHLNMDHGKSGFTSILDSEERKDAFLNVFTEAIDPMRSAVYFSDFNEFKESVYKLGLNNDDYCQAAVKFYNKVKSNTENKSLIKEALNSKGLLQEVQALAKILKPNKDESGYTEEGKLLVEQLKNYPKDNFELMDNLKIRLAVSYLRYKAHGESDEGALVVAIRSFNLVYGKDKNKGKEEVVFGQALLNAQMYSYDIHNTYFNQETAEEFVQSLQASFVGIGAQLALSEKGIRISKVIENGPIFKSQQLLKDDVIVAIEGDKKIVLGELREAIKKIKGPKDTAANLRVLRDGKVISVAVERGIVPVPGNVVKTETFTQEGKKYGYLQFGGFYRTVAADVYMKLVELNNENVEGLIIDMRNNGGGDLSQVSEMLGYFIGAGPTVLTKAASRRPKVMGNNSRAIFTKPIVVMINRNSASAAEILSGTLQAYNRAVIVGSEQSYGKGLVQNILYPGQIIRGTKMKGLFKLTTSAYYMPNGKSPQGGGVKSDIVLETLSPEEIEESRSETKDNPLMANIPELPSLFEGGHIKKILSDELHSQTLSALSAPLVDTSDDIEDVQRVQAESILNKYRYLLKQIKDTALLRPLSKAN